MEIWGSSYILHDVEPVRLAATLGSSTSRMGPGSVRVSFCQEPNVLAITLSKSRFELVAKWDVALRLMALLHVLVLQNRVLRDEKPELGAAPDRSRVFNVTGGLRASPIVCEWTATTVDVRCGPAHEGGADQFELVLTEGAAAELVMALAERIALNGTRTAREGSASK